MTAKSNNDGILAFNGGLGVDTIQWQDKPTIGDIMAQYKEAAKANSILEAFGPFVRDRKLESAGAEVPPHSLILYAQPVVYKSRTNPADPDCILLVMWKLLTYMKVSDHNSFAGVTGGFDEKLYELRGGELWCGNDKLEIDRTNPTNEHMLVYMEKSQKHILGIEDDKPKQWQ